MHPYSDAGHYLLEDARDAVPNALSEFFLKGTLVANNVVVFIVIKNAYLAFADY